MQNNDFVLPQDLYIKYFAGIDDLNFTHREMDVIACLVSARRTSKIAFLLSIAPSTVVTHIRNIMLKIGCNSQEGIIDFIEKSQKLSLLKKYYTSLVIQAAFEKSLKACFSLKKKDLSHLIIYCKDQKHRNALAYFLKTHLKLAGIEAEVHVKAVNPKINDIKHQNHIHLFLKEKDQYVKISKEFSGFVSVDISNQANYYFSVFEILRNLLPKLNLNQIISEFRRTYETMELNKAPYISGPNTLNLNQNDFFSVEDNFSRGIQYGKDRLGIFLLLKKRQLYVVLVLFVTVLIGSNFLIFRGNQGDMKAQTLTPAKELKRHFIRSDGVLPKESVFLQRPELLAGIDEKFKKANAIQTIALVGPGGTGKTTLARQYAYQQKTHVIWEINAETNESLKSSYESLAEALANKEADKKLLRAIKEMEKPEERENKIIQFVKEKLKTYPNWILIYDNLEKSTDIKKYFPQDLENWGSGKVILTTRDDNIQNSTYVDHVLPIGPLNSAQKYDLFCKIINKKENIALTASQDEKIKEFLKEIPPFPLDVLLAAHYLKSTNTSYSQYLESSLQNNRNFVTLQENLLRESGDYTKTRYRIITSSLQQIMNESEDFRDLLLLISLIASQNIPRDLLNKYKDNETVDNFIYHLKKYSLLINNSFVSSPQTSIISFHRSTHTMLLSYLKKALSLEKNTQLISSISSTLEHYMRDAIENENLLQMGSTKPHLKAFLSHEGLLNDDNKGAIEAELGCAYYYTHYHETAKKFLTSSISKLSRHPCKKNYPRIAQALSYLGNTHKELGEHHKARDLLEESLLLYSQHDPQNHVGITRALASLGDTYKNLGEHQKARDLLEKSIALSKQYLGSDQIGLARTMLYLGIVYRDLEDYKKAILLLKNSLILFNKHSPENSIELARALKYLGNTYRSLGRYEEARDLLEQSVVVCKKYLPENHIALGRSLVHLATIYKNLGEYEKAKDLLIQSLAIHQEVFGKNNVRTAWVITILANVHREMGKYEKAKKSINRCLKTYIKSYGENNLRTSWVFMQLGYVYEDLKNYREAREILETALKVHRSHFEEKHMKIAVISFHLGNVYKGLRQYKKANNFLEKSLRIYEKHYGKDHIETAKILESLGHLCFCKGNLDAAETIMNKALKMLQRKQHPSRFLLYEKLAELHLQKAQVEKNKRRAVEAEAFKAQAISELKQALTITQAFFSEHSAHTKRIRAKLNNSMDN